jgi:DNA invertase Pin-like site-specific DNA recombinase
MEKQTERRINLYDKHGRVLSYSYFNKYAEDNMLFNNQKIRFFGYARVSTNNQRENGCSIDAQISYIEDFCNMNNYTLLRIYVDDGISGSSTTDREGYNNMLKIVEDNINRIEEKTLGIIAFDQSRLTRDTYDYQGFLRFIRHNRLEFKLIEDPNMNINNPNTKLLMDIKSAINEAERTTAINKTRLTMRKCVEEGTLKGRAPYGVDKEGNPVSIEQEGLKYIYKFHDEGKSKWEIRKLMNEGFIDEDGNLIKIQYNNSKGRRKPRDDDESKIGVWTNTSINVIIDRYICSKRIINSNESVLYKDEVIKRKIKEIKNENPDASYTDLARGINEMSIYNCVITAKHISELQKPISKVIKYDDIYYYKTYNKILELKSRGITKSTSIATYLNNNGFKHNGKSDKWHHTTVDTFIKKCENNPPIKVETEESYNENNSEKTNGEFEIKLKKEYEDSKDKLREEYELKMKEEMEKMRKEYEVKNVRKSRFS